ncbi:MAG: stage II sporulation protein M [Ardenticatenaceae bacterium]|nr:stage II sporulation protein M [Ardenticatenaceae bacterium]
MNVEKFYQSRQNEWKQLTELLDRSQRAIEQLSPDEVKQLGKLYRAAASDLAVAQREFPTHRVTAYLNQLVARGHAVVYRSEPLAVKRMVRFVTQGFPRTFRETAWYTITAALLLIIPALAAGLLTNWRPEASIWLLPPQVQTLIPQIEDKDLWTDIPIEERPYASSFIMTNNIRVSFLAFSGGVTAGLLTLYAMIFNGLLIGGLLGLTSHYDVGFELGTFMVGHGVIELTTIFIAGGSGLMLGWAIVHPGLLRRRDALVLAARKALKLIVGCVPLLVIAGIIEGFISPNENIIWPVKWGVGVATGLILYSYLLLAGRSAQRLEIGDSDLGQGG